MNLTSAVALRVPPEMMSELALGMEDGAVIAQRHGFSAADFATLIVQPWFVKTLQAMRDDIEANGLTFKAKVAMLAEDLLLDAWAAAKNSESGSLKLDVAKYLTKVADLEPKQNAAVPAGGSGFVININLPEQYKAQVAAGGAQPAAPTIDVTPTQPSEVQELPAGPAPFIVPDFNLSGNDDLAALPPHFRGEP